MLCLTHFLLSLSTHVLALRLISYATCNLNISAKEKFNLINMYLSFRNEFMMIHNQLDLQSAF